MNSIINPNGGGVRKVMKGLKAFHVPKEQEEFPRDYKKKYHIKSPLSVLWYNLNFLFEDDYPAKMLQDFARDMILLYSKEDDIVWDGCCGSGTVPIIANRLNRLGIGTDINPKAVDLAISHQKDETKIPINKKFFVANAKTIDLLRDSGFGYADLILSSLPFGLNIAGDKNHYSELSEDISNSNNYDDFLKNAKEIIQNYYNNLKPGGICILDARDRTKNGKLYDLINYFRNFALEVGFELVARYAIFLMPYRTMSYKNKDYDSIIPMVSALDVIVLAKPEFERLQ